MYRSLVFIGVTLSLQGVSPGVFATDSGDAPFSYGLATHEIVDGAPWLGDDRPDSNTPYADASAAADDSDGFDDEGGVFAFPQLVQNAKAYEVNVFATNPGPNDATLVGWVDFDGSGYFDRDEAIVASVPAGTMNGKFKLIWPNLSGIASDYLGVSYARFRISTDHLSTITPQGIASDGEVEDFRLEILADTDGDERPDIIDLDDDNDGIPDSVEGMNDPDGDSIGNSVDTDSDGDGVPDFIETGSNPGAPQDTDGDGVPDYLDEDSDNDGSPDSEPLAADADQDGIVDDLEGAVPGQDTDGDGIANINDLDSDNDTIPDAIEVGSNPAAPADTDGDGIPDFLDLDSDNDGVTDIREANSGELNVSLIDVDGDGQVDVGQITGANGLVDVAETDPDSGIPIFSAADSDGDGIRDYADLDSDNDGVFDIAETLGVDADGDGRVDGSTDPDQDGLVDGANAFLNVGLLPDTDGDFIPDTQDGDADGSTFDVTQNPGGTDGTDGAGGTDGTDGAGGTDGTDGAGGTDGTDGAGGTDGTDGAGGTDGTDGAGGTDGTDGAGGTDGADGAGGTDGADGAGGTDGTDGAGGTDGTDGAGGTDGTDDESPSEDAGSTGTGGIKTGLSGGAGCSVYSVRPGSGGTDPALPAMLMLSGLAFLFRKRAKKNIL